MIIVVVPLNFGRGKGVRMLVEIRLGDGSEDASKNLETSGKTDNKCVHFATSPHACMDDSGPMKHTLTGYIGPEL